MIKRIRMGIRARAGAAAVLAAIGLAAGGMTAAHAGVAGVAGVSAQAATCGAWFADGAGNDLAIAQGTHGQPVQVMPRSANKCAAIVEVSEKAGGWFQLIDGGAGGGLCLTVNEAESNGVYWESCSTSVATYWDLANSANGDYQSEILFNQGITARNLGAWTAGGGCLATPNVVVAEGGVALGECHIDWRSE